MVALSLAYGTKKAVIEVFHSLEDYLANASERMLVSSNELQALLEEDMLYFCDTCQTFHIKDNWEYEEGKELEAIQQWLSERE